MRTLTAATLLTLTLMSSPLGAEPMKPATASGSSRTSR